MINDKLFDILVSIFFSMSHQLGSIGTKAQNLVAPFQLTEGESLPNFHLQYLQVRIKNYILNDKAGQKTFTGKYIMEL